MLGGIVKFAVFCLVVPHMVGIPTQLATSAADQMLKAERTEVGQTVVSPNGDVQVAEPNEARSEGSGEMDNRELKDLFLPISNTLEDSVVEDIPEVEGSGSDGAVRKKRAIAAHEGKSSSSSSSEEAEGSGETVDGSGSGPQHIRITIADIERKTGSNSVEVPSLFKHL